MNVWTFLALVVLIAWASFCLSVAITVALNAWTKFRSRYVPR